MRQLNKVIYKHNIVVKMPTRDHCRHLVEQLLLKMTRTNKEGKTSNCLLNKKKLSYPKIIKEIKISAPKKLTLFYLLKSLNINIWQYGRISHNKCLIYFFFLTIASIYSNSENFKLPGALEKIKYPSF